MIFFSMATFLCRYTFSSFALQFASKSFSVAQFCSRSTLFCDLGFLQDAKPVAMQRDNKDEAGESEIVTVQLAVIPKTMSMSLVKKKLCCTYAKKHIIHKYIKSKNVIKFFDESSKLLHVCVLLFIVCFIILVCLLYEFQPSLICAHECACLYAQTLAHAEVTTVI